MKLSVWQCDNCGKCYEFPDNEQPLAHFICLGPTWKHKQCPGTVVPVASTNTSGTKP